MTAEIAVMNKLGIALAADSAASIGAGADKIYAADKLFPLTGHAPVGVMVYGNAEFLGVPWETVVGAYRKQLGDKTFGELSDYADAFFGFVEDNRAMFPLSVQEKYVGDFQRAVFHAVMTEAEVRYDEAHSRGEAPAKTLDIFIREVALEYIQAQEANDPLAGFGPAARRDLLALCKKFFSENFIAVFGDVSFPQEIDEALESLVLESISRANVSYRLSGIVFAGFGEDEYAPVCLEHRVGGMALNKLRLQSVKRTAMGKDADSAILPFAQDKTVRSFLKGVHPDYLAYQTKAVEDLLDASAEWILRRPELHADTALKDKIAKSNIDLLKKLVDDWYDESRMGYWGPVVDMVQFLPKDELASTAENLVNLTKFRLRIGPERETVGGPIDVALITKGDGFVWVKKKRYYPAELNPK